MARRPTTVIFALGLILSCCLLIPSLSGSPGLNPTSGFENRQDREKERSLPSRFEAGVDRWHLPAGAGIPAEWRTRAVLSAWSGEHGRSCRLRWWTGTRRLKRKRKWPKQSAELVEKAHKQEEARRLDNVSDIDASLRVGDGAFLPSGEGMFCGGGKNDPNPGPGGIRDEDGQKAGDCGNPLAGKGGSGKTDDCDAGSARGGTAEIQQPGILSAGSATRSKYDERHPEKPADGRVRPDVELVKTKVGRNSRALESINSIFRAGGERRHECNLDAEMGRCSECLPGLR